MLHGAMRALRWLPLLKKSSPVEKQAGGRAEGFQAKGKDGDDGEWGVTIGYLDEVMAIIPLSIQLLDFRIITHVRECH